MPENFVFSPSGWVLSIFQAFFRHFSDILSTFPLSGLSDDMPVTKQKQQNTDCLGVNWCAFLADMCFFVRLAADKYETLATMVAIFLEPWKGSGSSVRAGKTHGNIACC